jgi:transcriptional regulator with PAS, ATPase and Fis domain
VKVNQSILRKLREGQDAEDLLKDYRDQVVLAALQRHHGNRSQAAIDLKIHRNTIRLWLREMEQRGEIQKGHAGRKIETRRSHGNHTQKFR